MNCVLVLWGCSEQGSPALSPAVDAGRVDAPHDVRCVLPVLGDVLRQPEDVAVVPLHQLLERRDIAGLGRPYQGKTTNMGDGA